MKNRQEKGGSVGLRQKTHDFFGGKGRKWERAKITTFQSQVSNWPYRFTDEFVCRIHLKHSGFQRHRGAQRAGRAGRAGREAPAIRERRKQEIGRKTETEREGERERNVNHMLLLWSQHVSIPVLARPPAWPTGSVCARKRLTENERVHWSTSTRTRVDVFTLPCNCASVWALPAGAKAHGMKGTCG